MWKWKVFNRICVWLTLVCGLVAALAGLATAAEPIFGLGTKPELLQEHGAGEGPAWHPELGLLTSGEGNINRRDKQGKIPVDRPNGLVVTHDDKYLFVAVHGPSIASTGGSFPNPNRTLTV